MSRYDVFRLGEAVLAGDAARALRMLDGLQAEGENGGAGALDAGRRPARPAAAARGRAPGPAAADGAARGAGLGAWKEKLFRQVLPRLEATELAALVEAAHVCDGIVRGLRDPRCWPDDPWAALQRLVLMTLAAVAPVPGCRRW